MFGLKIRDLNNTARGAIRKVANGKLMDVSGYRINRRTSGEIHIALLKDGRPMGFVRVLDR